MKLAVGYSWSSDFIFTDFLETALNMTHPSGYEVRYFRGSGQRMARRHLEICERALEWGADLICFIDADQIHPQDMLVKLTKRIEEGCNVISAQVPFRGYVDWQKMKPFQPTGWRLECDGVQEFKSLAATSHMAKAIDPADGDLQRVHIIGTGVLMFPADCLFSLEQPWLFDVPDPKTQQRISDTDAWFVWRLQTELGLQVWVDTTIKVQHCLVFKVDDTFSERFADWTDPERADTSICKFAKLYPKAGE